MAQFTQYLYEYKNGERIRNLGFMKVEKHMDKTVIQIYAKQLDEVTGIQLQREGGRKYLATWETDGEDRQESPVQTPQQSPPRQGFPVQTPQQSPLRQESPTQTLQQNLLRAKSPAQPSPSQIPTAQTLPAPRTLPRQNVAPREEMPQREMPQREMPQREMPQMKMSQEEITRNEVEEITPYIPPSTRHYEKIQRQNLSRLPRREWRLANNSFLLHGFYNYHHLLYIEDGEQTWIGVPGIYHEKEKAAANAFGFTEFQRLTDIEIELSDEEKNTYEDFGYWCRQVERS